MQAYLYIRYAAITSIFYDRYGTEFTVKECTSSSECDMHADIFLPFHEMHKLKNSFAFLAKGVS